MFDLILYVPVNNYSVMLGHVFLGWTGTKQWLFGCVSLAPKGCTPLPCLRLRLTPITWPGMGSKPLQSSKNGAKVLTLWYEPIKGKTGLAASTPWLKFGEIGVRRKCAYLVSRHVTKINRVPRRLKTTPSLRPAKTKEMRPMSLAQGHDAVMPVRLEPTALRSRVRSSTTQPLLSQP